MTQPNTPEGLVVAMLADLVDGNIFNDIAPPGTAIPYIVIERVGGRFAGFLSRDVPSKRHAHMQVDVVATSRAEASLLSQQVEDTFVRARHIPQGSPTSNYDETTGMYGSSQDFSVWWDR